MKAVLAGIALCLGSLAANAALVEYNFTATMKSPLDAGAGPWLQSVSVGTVGTGSFVLDNAVPNANGTDFAMFQGYYPGSFVSGNFTIGGMTFTSSGTLETISFPGSTNQVKMSSSGGSVSGVDAAWRFSFWRMIFWDSQPALFASNAIPDTFNVADYSLKEFTLWLRNEAVVDSWGATLDVTSIERVEANAVPEPASFALVGVGLLGIAALRRRSVQRR